MIQNEIKINLYAQDRLSRIDIIDWFGSLDNNSKRDTLNQLYWYIINVKPSKDEIEISINNSNLKRTYTPIIMILKEPINISVPKILNLPENELEKSFLLLIEIFKTADKRRRNNDCKGKCSHEWHNLNND